MHRLDTFYNIYRVVGWAPRRSVSDIRFLCYDIALEQQFVFSFDAGNRKENQKLVETVQKVSRFVLKLTHIHL